MANPLEQVGSSAPPQGGGCGVGDARLDSLLAFEESPDVLQFRFEHDGGLMWPFIRYSIMAYALAALSGLQSPLAMPANLSATQALRYAWLSVRHSPLRIRRPFDIVIIGSTSGLVTKQGGAWLGRIN